MKDTNYVGVIELILSNSNEYSNLILKNKRLNDHLIISNLIILVCTMVYGIVTGFFVGGAQIFINAIKIPIIIFSLIYISLPVFYVFNLFINRKIRIKQMTAIILSGFSITSIIMGAFAPVLLLFSITTINVHFIVLLNVSIGILAIICGLFFIYQIFHSIHQNGNEYISLIMGYFIILFSAPQLLWAMRPYFHYIDGFIEPIKSNFYIEIIKVAASEPLLTATLALIFSLVGILIIYNLSDDSESMSIESTKHGREIKRKKRTIKKLKDLSRLKKVKMNGQPEIPYRHPQNSSSQIYPNYPYPYYYNPYMYRYPQDNSDQK